MTLEIERAREALEQGDAEEALSWLWEGVARAVEADDTRQLRQLREEALRVAYAAPRLRAPARALERMASQLGKDLPSRAGGGGAGWRRAGAPKPVFEAPEREAGSDAPATGTASEYLADFLEHVSAHLDEDGPK